MTISFIDKWNAVQAEKDSKLAIGIAPRIADLPHPIMRYDSPFLPFGRAIIEATRDVACAYVFSLGNYLALGAAGIIELERTLPLVPSEIITIMHVPVVMQGYSEAFLYSALTVDAVTLATGNLEIVRPFASDPAHGAFVSKRAAVTPKNDHNSVGFYDEDRFELGSSYLKWVTDPIIYASGRDDFADKMRDAAEIYRIESLKDKG